MKSLKMKLTKILDQDFKFVVENPKTIEVETEDLKISTINEVS